MAPITRVNFFINTCRYSLSHSNNLCEALAPLEVLKRIHAEVDALFARGYVAEQDMSLLEDYTELKKQTLSTPAPNKHFKVMVNSRRH